MDNLILDQDQVEESHHSYAGFWLRLFAALVDLLVFIPVYVLSFLNDTGWKSLLLSIALTWTFPIYKIWFEGTSGATLGKKALNLKVVAVNGEVMGYNRAAMRNCLYILSALLSSLTTIMIFNSPGFSNVDNYTEYNKFAAANGLGLIFIFFLLYVISIIVMFFNTQRQTLHDKIGKTFVVIN